jgi:hypothetical protein
LYHDEGSRYYHDFNNVFNVTGNSEYNLTGVWLQRNESPLQTTGNITANDIAVAVQDILQNGTNVHGDEVFDIVHYSSTDDLTTEKMQVIASAGKNAPSGPGSM